MNALKKHKHAHIWGWIAKNTMRCIPAIILLTLLSIGISLISLRFTAVSKSLMDIATGAQEGKLFYAIFRLIILMVLQLIVQVAITFLNVHADAKMDIELKRNVFRTLIHKDYSAVSKYHSGELLNRLTSDLGIIVSGVIAMVPNVALILTNLIGGFLMLYRLDWMFALMILSVGPLILISSRLYSRRYKQLHKDCQAAAGKVRSFMQETLQNLLVIKSFNSQNRVLDHNETLQRKSYRLQIKRTKISITAHILMYIAFNAGYYFALSYGAWKISKGLMTFGTVTAMLQLVGKIQTPFRDISGLVPKALSISASVERIQELENMPEESHSGIELDKDVYAAMDSIQFENVTFGYGEAMVMENVSFSISKGSFAVIAGESGAGKSTAIKLLLGIIHPHSGEIYLKTTDGRRLPLGSNSRALFAYVPQGSLILSGSIRENICFARTDATDEEIIHAAKIAQIWDFIETLDQGLDTMLGEKGLGLSEGQIQRLSIARALLYDAPILLLDESTSALDSATETAFLRAVKSLTDKTCIIVSHKKAAFDVCDQVIQILPPNV